MRRSLLRWTSLVASAVIFGGLGVRRVHLTNFPLFFGVVVCLACLVVAVFVLTRGEDEHA